MTTMTATIADEIFATERTDEVDLVEATRTDYAVRHTGLQRSRVDDVGVLVLVFSVQSMWIAGLAYWLYWLAS